MTISIERDVRDGGQIAFSVILVNPGLADGLDAPTQDATLASLNHALRIHGLGTIAEAQWDYRCISLLVQLAGDPHARNLHLVRDEPDWDAVDPRLALIERYIRIGFDSLPKPWGSQ